MSPNSENRANLDRSTATCCGAKAVANRTHGGSCSPLSRLSTSFRPRSAGLATLTAAPRELLSNYGDRSRLVDTVQISAVSSDC